jgi:hypothetical protein
MPFQRFELLSILQTHDVVRLYRYADWDGWLLGLRHGANRRCPHKSGMDIGDKRCELVRMNAVTADKSANDFGSQLGKARGIGRIHLLLPRVIL